jgi:hypothetical protein
MALLCTGCGQGLAPMDVCWYGEYAYCANCVPDDPGPTEEEE